MSETNDGGQKTKRVVKRSPKHPTMGLEDAIQAAKQLHQQVWDQPISAEGACEVWGLSYSSSTGKRTLSALLQFGLLASSGSKDSRTVRLTERGKDLVMGRDGNDRYPEALKEAALEPTTYQETWDKWGPELPTDDPPMTHWLRREMGFNPNSTADFLRDFRATMQFAGVDKSGRRSQIGNGEKPDNASGQKGDKPLPSTGSGGTRHGDKGDEKGDRPMPSTGSETKRDWDLTIPLVGGGQAVLRVPIPVTPEDFDLLKGVITSNLDAMRKAIVRTPSPTRDGGDDDTR